MILVWEILGFILAKAAAWLGRHFELALVIRDQLLGKVSWVSRRSAGNDRGTRFTAFFLGRLSSIGRAQCILVGLICLFQYVYLLVSFLASELRKCVYR